jgi:general secretion pathway protein I
LVEALVALAIISVSLSSIGALIATTVRGTRTVDANLSRLHAARSVLAALPNRGQLTLGTFSGDFARHQWRVDVSPFIASNSDPAQRTPWVPQHVVVTVQSSAGVPLQINSLRLRRGAGG